METKQFNLQSPEQIAKDYGGNKQKIAQAASMGMVDPTAAVLAGMFIDRMRSAQMMEQQPQGTVAQQVFQPQQAPQGAPPQGAPPPMGAPPMGAPLMGAPPPPQPPGMAMGGLMDLSVPDDMFSEPGTDAENFAGGGLVAFAMGGEAGEEDEEDEPFLLRPARKVFSPASGVRDQVRRDYKPGERIPFSDSLVGRGLAAASDTVFGSPEARAEAIRARKKYEAAATAANQYGRDRSAYGVQGALAPVFGGEVPVHPSLRPLSADARPSPSTRAAAPFRQQDSRSEATRPTPAPAPRPAAMAAPTAPRAAMTAPTAPRGLAELAATQGAAPGPAAVSGAPTAPGAPAAPQAPAGPTGLQGGIEEYMRLQKQYGGDAATPYRDRLAAAAEAQLDPKAMAAQKKQDMWQAVAQFGFNMAATNSPSFMQAAGQAGAATVPFMAASRKERKAAERDALKQLADIEGLTTAEKKQAFQSGVAYHQNLADDQRQDSQFAQTMGLAERKFAFEKQEAGASRAAAAAARRDSGGIGTPDFPGGMDGYRLERFYKAEMAKVPQLLAKNPRIKAEYDANPQAWMARYSADAERRALLSVEEQKGGGGRPRRGSPTPSGGGSSADLSDAEIKRQLGL